MTAAQMKQMMQGVVLHGTGKKAILEGYSSAGKTGTGQKVDPSTRTYSKTKYVASFAGFAPINDPSITVAVILDSPVGLHQGGQVSAPVFQRVAQQVLEYLHAPHDVELPPSRQVLMAERRVKEKDIEEGSPDRLGDTLETADAGATEVASAESGAGDLNPQAPATSAKPTPSVTTSVVVPAALRERERPSGALENRHGTGGNSPSTLLGDGETKPNGSQMPVPLPSTGTVVLEVEQGGILVPSFLGKSVRAAIEMAQENGLDLDAVGNGLAREQSPSPGSHVASGSSVTVKFGR
jgi:cell division protein FtsI (penicillin-binding protein 3)